MSIRRIKLMLSKRNKSRMKSVFAILATIVGFANLSTSVATGASWAATGSLTTTRYLHTATLLPSGKVLVAGKYDASTELYDPVTGAWTTTGSMTTPRLYHSATLLPNGKVLVSGGYNDVVRLASTELYDPATGGWTTTGSLTNSRYVHTATLLPNGKVLVAGGYNDNSGVLGRAELYDPAAGA